MKNFNTFQELIEKSQRIGRNIVLLGKKGDFNAIQLNYKGENRNNMTQGEVLIYDESVNWVGWKCVYKNTKGFFIKKKTGTFYLKF